jgi:opacity protein-like surface antigen
MWSSKPASYLLSECKTVFMKPLLLCFLFFISQAAVAQLHVGVFAGGASYMGDLNDKPFKRTKPAIGASLNYEVSDRFMLRSGITFGRVEGGDQYSGTEQQKQIRNLSFKSDITELSLMGELTAFNLYNIRWSPYAFAGIAFYHFNPYVTDSLGTDVFLQPLSTEGQGLAEYPNRKPYKLNQWAIPFGAGIKYNLSDNVRLGFELGFRRLFTDYLDDVSTSFVDENILLAGRGSQAVAFSYRGDEVAGELPSYPDNGYPAKDAQRGNPKTKDWYYFTGLHLTFRIGGGYGRTDASKKSKSYGCPVMPM